MVYESNEINLIKLQDGTDGKPGKDGESGKTLYTWVKYSQYADGTNLTDDPTNAVYIGIAYNKEDKIESNNKTDYTWSKIKGEDGQDGTNGKDGASITIKSTSITYQASSSGTTTPTGTWSTSVPSVSNGQYLWTKTVVNYSDGKSTTSYSVAYKGTNGTNGTDGSDGRGIKSTSTTYQVGASGTTVPMGTWSSLIPATSASAPFMWTKTVLTYTDNTTSTSYSVGSTPDSIEIGGRNYFSSKKQTAFDKNNEYTLPTYQNKGSYKQFYNLTVPMSYFVGKNCKLSFDAISPNGDTELRVYNDSSKPRYLMNTIVISKIGTTWVHQELTITVTDKGETYTESTSNKIEFYFPTQMGCKIRNVKFEIGNKATDWTPAPEDISVENVYTPNTTTIDGGKITTGTITADKINVNNLDAITANIGLWHIEDGKLVADITKSSIDDEYNILRHTVKSYDYNSSGDISLRKQRDTIMNNDGIYVGYIESTNDPITTELYPGASGQRYYDRYTEYSDNRILYLERSYNDEDEINVSANIIFDKVLTGRGYNSIIKLIADDIELDTSNSANGVRVNGTFQADDIQTTSGANLDTINSNLNSKGSMVLLASTKSTSFVSLTVNNLNNYKCVVVAACAGTVERIIATTVIPTDYFKSSTASANVATIYAGEPNIYCAEAYYSANTKVYLKSKNSAFCIAALFGII